MTGLDASSNAGSWAAAERAAERHRQERLDPSRARAAADRRLRPVVIALWFLATALALLGRLGPAGTRIGVLLAAEVALVLLLVLGLIWLVRSDRFLLRGSPSSIKGALPAGAWPPVRRQLAGRMPVDPEHRDVVVELAHQHRRLLAGSVATAAWYLPFYLAITALQHGWIGPASLTLGVLAIAAVPVLAAVAYRRFDRVIAQPLRTAP